MDTTAKRVRDKYLYRQKLGLIFHHQQALREYLKKHPKADPSKHKVVKPESKGQKEDTAKARSETVKNLSKTLLKDSESREKAVKTLADAAEDLNKAPQDLQDSLSKEFKAMSSPEREDTVKALGLYSYWLSESLEKWDKDFGSGDWDEKKENQAAKLLKDIQDHGSKVQNEVKTIFGESPDVIPKLKGEEKAKEALEKYEKKPWYKKLFATDSV